MVLEGIAKWRWVRKSKCEIENPKWVRVKVATLKDEIESKKWKWKQKVKVNAKSESESVHLERVDDNVDGRRESQEEVTAPDNFLGKKMKNMRKEHKNIKREKKYETEDLRESCHM